MLKKSLSIFLSLLLIISLCVPVFAQEQEEETQPQAEREELTISTREEFLEFAENCRLDTYSQDLNVALIADIDLTDTGFQGVPIFSGTFDGNGYTISGLTITGEGSVQGLFRYLTETALVKDLSLKGDVQPQGSRGTVGGVAGRNAGRIENCTFAGLVSGGDWVGGIVGINTVTGVIDNCTAGGDIHGNHFVGGIAGENQGVIRKSINNALVNTTPQQNSVEIEDITLDSLTDTEDASTVTDVGGIAGANNGVLRDCVNYGDVGYKHMGYNIGGIAGSQRGYIMDCENHGSISGRKEVGGIVGHMEPVTKLEYSEDTLQILQEQLSTLSGLTNQASANAQNSAGNITSQISVLQDQVDSARDALDTLLPDTPQVDPENPELPEITLPDEDTILAAQSNLSSALNGMQGSLSSIAASTQNAASTLTSDMQAVAGQVGAMGQTVNEAEENLGGTIVDVSDQDTTEDTTGKVEKCVNYGPVLADRNVGGVVGAMALETDLNTVEGVDVLGDISLNFQGELRAVVLDCANEGAVSGSKQHVGGIAGWMQMGLVKNSDNFGAVEGQNADYVGGIAGNSSGFVRNCNVKSRVSGSAYVGGIAGSGTVVSNCRTMVLLTGEEKLGGILGYGEESEEEAPVQGNFCLPVENDLGGIDGISYDGCAQSLALEEFLALEDLPEWFRKLRVTFAFDDGSIETVEVTAGETLREEDIPQLPEKAGHTGLWENLHRDITFDTTFQAVYETYAQTIESAQTGENGLPVLLAEGVFTPETALELAEAKPQIALQKREIILEGWEFADVGQTTLRYLLPEDAPAEQVRVLLHRAGTWQEAEFTVDGQYLVLDGEGTQGLCLVYDPKSRALLYGGIAVVAVLLILVEEIHRCRRKKKKAPAEETV